MATYTISHTRLDDLGAPLTSIPTGTGTLEAGRIRPTSAQKNAALVSLARFPCLRRRGPRSITGTRISTNSFSRYRKKKDEIGGMRL